MARVKRPRPRNDGGGAKGAYGHPRSASSRSTVRVDIPTAGRNSHRRELTNQNGEESELYSDLSPGRPGVNPFFSTCVGHLPDHGRDVHGNQNKLGDRLGRDVILIPSQSSRDGTPARLSIREEHVREPGGIRHGPPPKKANVEGPGQAGLRAA